MNGTRFYHRRLGEGRVTICLVDSQALIGNSVAAGFAWCSPDDNFCRRLGRKIAQGRARRSPVFFGADATWRDVLEEAIEWAGPEWAKTAYAATARPKRMTPDWQPSPDVFNWALLKYGQSEALVRRAAERFRFYWLGSSAEVPLDAEFRNWLRTCHRYSNEADQ